jgi:hypothetical protein
MHAMSDGKAQQTAQDAQNATMNFINQQMQGAQEVFDSGDTSDAMFLFGISMHPVMDYSSPAHTNPRGNPIPWCGLFGSCSHTFQHGGDSDSWNPWTIEDVAHLNTDPTAQAFESMAIRNWFQQLTGRTCMAGRK